MRSSTSRRRAPASSRTRSSRSRSCGSTPRGPSSIASRASSDRQARSRPRRRRCTGSTTTSVACAPFFAELAGELLGLLDGAVFVAHNADFDLPLLEHAFARAGIRYRPPGVACTLDAFRLLEPAERSHRLESLCERHGVPLDHAHDARGDVLATVALLRILLARGIAPETVELDHAAYMRLRSRGDTRPVSEPQVRRVFALARRAGLVALDGTVDRDAVVALVERVSGARDVEALTREQVQDVYDELELLVVGAEESQAASA